MAPSTNPQQRNALRTALPLVECQLRLDMGAEVLVFSAQMPAERTRMAKEAVGVLLRRPYPSGVSVTWRTVVSA